ncbi:MAG: class I SAM-dependent methyltransferase family protein [Candidatus Bathyarchaeota archaeon]|nr:class I SAM-dependent methyltransferase family protein [Candidatus Bathyarchaeota archaeon]
MRKRLPKTLSGFRSFEEMGKFCNSFDIIGDIAIIKLPCNSAVNAKTAAKAIMSRNKNLKTVLLQTSPVSGDFRLRCLSHVAGENKTSTVHKELGCLFFVDTAKSYFSPRLSYERMRIAKLVKPNETIVNMFAGVGCFSIIIAKHANPAKVFSIDINSAAIQYMNKNVRFNRVYDKVIPLLGDSKELIKNRLQRVADRVLMPLPEKALEYSSYALRALKVSGGWIHYYTFEHATKTESPAEKAKSKVVKKLCALGVDFEASLVRFVRSTGPNWFQLAVDVKIM